MTAYRWTWFSRTRTSLTAILVLLVLFFLAGTGAPACAQPLPPVITQISPPSVTVGGPSFTLTVSGSNFLPYDVVRVDGSNRATTFVSGSQLSALILASDIAVIGSRQITVFDPQTGLTSNAASLTITPLPLPRPTLSSVNPATVSAGGRQVRLTLVGTNFRSGARVVVSPPLGSPAESTGTQSAGDIAVESVARLNDTLMQAVINLSPQATLGVRAVDVVNTDQTSTARPPTGGLGTSQPLYVAARDSLAAPLEIQSVIITHPRNGTITTQGEDLYGEAILAGVGTGIVTGQWLWDGAVSEQFTARLAGGERTTLRTARSLPTLFLGPHILELRVTTPNLMQSRAVQIVVNPGDWRLMRLLGPGPGAGFSSDAPPLLRWAIIPGAAKYQVGFSSRPMFLAVDVWHDVEDTQWRVPEDVWSALPEGDIYWTVRAVDPSGQPRKPAWMRRILRVPAGALGPVHAVPGRSAAGTTVVEWQGFGGQTLYRLAVSRDAEGKDVVRRFLTREPRADLRAIQRLLESGRTYFWQVEAISADGFPIFVGARHSFVAGALPRAALQPRMVSYEIASLHAVPPPSLADLIGKRLPEPNSAVAATRPPILVQLKGKVNPADLALNVDDTDVTALATVTEEKLSFQPILPLGGGEHQVSITLGPETASWKFSVQQKPEAAPGAGALGNLPGTDAEAPLSAAGPGGAGPAAEAGAAIGPVVNTQISSNTQWVSGSAPDTNQVAIAQQLAYQNGPWRAEVNGSGLLNSVLGPKPRRALGRFNDYAFRVAYDQPRWGANLRFGVLAPALYLNSEFITTASAREGVEPSLRTPAGTLAFYTNTNDNALGNGTGVSFHQRILGASYQAPLPKERATLRLMWLGARDVGAPTKIGFDAAGNPTSTADPLAAAGAGDAYGGLLQVHLSKTWLWSSEYAWSENNPNIRLAGSRRRFGRAWRSGVTGSWWNTTFSAAYRDVGPNFATPANPSLSLLSNPGRRGLDSSVSRPTIFGTFTVGYQYLQSDVQRADRPRLSLHNLTWGWSKNLGAATVLAVQGHETRTFTGTLPAVVRALPVAQQLALRSDTRDLGFNVALTRTVGTVALTFGGTRNFFRNRLIDKQNIITSGINVGANWRARSFFQLQSNVGVNWVAGDKLSVGGNRVVTTYITPMFLWQRAGLTVSPLLTVNQSQTRLGTGLMTLDLFNSQYGGRVTWQMPVYLRFSTLSMEGAKLHARDAIRATTVDDIRVLLVWTLVGSFHRGGYDLTPQR